MRVMVSLPMNVDIHRNPCPATGQTRAGRSAASDDDVTAATRERYNCANTWENAESPGL